MTSINYEIWEPVIGLEVHVQLNTLTKLFASSRNHFGDEPNTNIDEVDTGQPGALPVLNAEAVKKAVQFGLAIHSDVMRFSSFDRKSYFYPDSPRNFQITQFTQPIIRGGTIICDVEGKTKHFLIKEAHLEDDSGMLKHFTSFTGVDYNRAGIPLIEVVSEPMIHSPKDAAAFAGGLRAIMQYLNISDCNMEEGSLRFDVNVSVRPRGDKTLRPKVEIKNMNSFHNMQLAVEAESRRQIQAYTRNPEKDFAKAIAAGTYRFDLASKKTYLMRRKEEAHDYRYFPEPDLVPIVLSEEYLETLKASIPELPHQRYLRYISELNIPNDSAAILINDKYVSDFFEEALKIANNPTSLCNWLIVEFAGRLKEKKISLKESKLQSKHVGHLVKMIEDKVITGRIAKQVADEMIASPSQSSEQIVKENPKYQPLEDSSIIEPIVDEVLKQNPQALLDYKVEHRRKRVLGFLVGQVMKQTEGKASPDLVNKILRKKIE